MTDSLLAPSREVLHKLYHTGELVEATILVTYTEGENPVRLKYSRIGRGYLKVLIGSLHHIVV
eukprot:CAMPEP_0174350514 /NCGR_PEP_ID=MMETSP0811_2-20130205/7627_1 /TAXON_ID=73025 ORGANISM="Eutreptiella gymnastica-like, Strain CCMP1594" /NCGR_SAMPLE_ID=MMETSP0811_2 /ASSEMBLY_ACC=CAM_ASM_000667 /LENGTH=62 /DNA_ID=CAMNT_0015478905 /DNA_START=243 /DNA_END=431 /DNA_ORIENTATION=+